MHDAELDDVFAGEFSGRIPPLNSTSIALETTRVVKAGAGVLFGFAGYASVAGTFVLVFDASTVPANGAVPVVVIDVASAGSFSYDGGEKGRSFNQGIVLAGSTTAVTLTLADADYWFDAQYV